MPVEAIARVDLQQDRLVRQKEDVHESRAVRSHQDLRGNQPVAWIFRGEESRRRRGCRRGYSEKSRGDAADSNFVKVSLRCSGTRTLKAS